MNKSQKNSKSSKPEVEKGSFINKYLEKFDHIQEYFRKNWINILSLFSKNLDDRRYSYGERPHNIRDWYEQILKYRSYGTDILKKIFKWIRSYIFYIIVLLTVLLIFINNWAELLIFIESFLRDLLNPLFVLNFTIIFFIIVGAFWWFTTPEGDTFGGFLLRTKGIVLRLLTAVIVVSGFYFGISYPPAWFDEAKIVHNISLASYGEKTWISIPKRISSLHEPLNIRNILIGVFGLVSLLFLWWRNNIADDNLKLEEKRRLDERFHEATETLSKNLNFETYPSHIGGIFTLTQLALDSKELTQRCLDVICSCNEWMKPYVDEFKYGRIDKCYSERELSGERNYSNSKTKNNKDLVNNLYKKNRWGKIVSLEEEKRSQKALHSVAVILQTISIRESQEDYNFIKLSELNFRSVMLCGINLRGLKLVGINLREAYLNGADLQGATLNKAKLQYTKFKGANLLQVKLEEANLTGVQLDKSILKKANLSRAIMRGAELQGADISDSILSWADIKGAKLQRTNLSNSILFGANISNSNLQFANLNFSLLHGVNLDNSKLQGANLRFARLVGASLRETQLEGTNMTHTNLQAALFYKANLLGANLLYADISYSIFWYTNFYSTNLKEIFKYHHRITTKKAIRFKEVNNKVKLPLIFNDISVNEDKTIISKEEWLNKIIEHAPSPEKAKEFKECMRKGWKLMKNKDKPKELNKLKNNSILKKKGKNIFVIQDVELVKKFQEHWIELASSHEAIAIKLLSYSEIFFYDEEWNKVDIMDTLMSKTGKILYKKLKKTAKLKSLVKDMRDNVRRRYY